MVAWFYAFSWLLRTRPLTSSLVFNTCKLLFQESLNFLPSLLLCYCLRYWGCCQKRQRICLQLLTRFISMQLLTFLHSKGKCFFPKPNAVIMFLFVKGTYQYVTLPVGTLWLALTCFFIRGGGGCGWWKDILLYSSEFLEYPFGGKHRWGLCRR